MKVIWETLIELKAFFQKIENYENCITFNKSSRVLKEKFVLYKTQNNKNYANSMILNQIVMLVKFDVLFKFDIVSSFLLIGKKYFKAQIETFKIKSLIELFRSATILI